MRGNINEAKLQVQIGENLESRLKIHSLIMFSSLASDQIDAIVSLVSEG